MGPVPPARPCSRTSMSTSRTTSGPGPLESPRGPPGPPPEPPAPPVFGAGRGFRFKVRASQRVSQEASQEGPRKRPRMYPRMCFWSHMLMYLQKMQALCPKRSLSFALRFQARIGPHGRPTVEKNMFLIALDVWYRRTRGLRR